MIVNGRGPKNFLGKDKSCVLNESRSRTSQAKDKNVFEQRLKDLAMWMDVQECYM